MKTKSTMSEIEISQLKSIREQKNVSIETLAETLKVTRDFIKYIESGQFEKLGAPTFVKGHVSNYCRALGLPYETVLQQIPEKHLTTPTLQTPDALGVSPLARVKRRSSHLGRYAVGTALLGMLALSFYFVWDKWRFPSQKDDLNLQLTDSNNSNDKKNGKNVTYSSLIPQVKLQGEQKSSTSDEGVEEDEQLDSVDDVSETQHQVNEAGEETIDDVNQSEQQLTPIQAEAQYSIQLQLTEDAWVSIKTHDGNKIEHDLVKAGEYLYSSDQPLHFRIGNATKAQVKINDNLINLNDFMSRDIADFDWPKDPG